MLKTGVWELRPGVIESLNTSQFFKKKDKRKRKRTLFTMFSLEFTKYFQMSVPMCFTKNSVRQTQWVL